MPLPIELDHKALRALKKLNFEQIDVAHARLDKMNEMGEFYLYSYKILALYDEKMKLYHDRRIEMREFQPSDLIFVV